MEGIREPCAPVPAVNIGGECVGVEFVLPIVRLGINAGKLGWRAFSSWMWPYTPTDRQCFTIGNLDRESHEDAAKGWGLTLKWCAEAKAQFGYVANRTKADEMAVGAWLRKQMKGNNVRNVDIIRVLPYATAAVFVPTDADLVANNIHKQSKIRSRVSMMKNNQRN